MNALIGLLETYRLMDLLEQGYEKRFLDQKKYRNLRFPNSDNVFSGRQFMMDSVPPFEVSVCFVLHRFYYDSYGGTERFVMQMAKQILKHGGSVHVLAYSARPGIAYSNEYEDILYEYELIEEVPVIRFRHRKAPHGIIKDFLENDDLLKNFAVHILEKLKPQIVHLAHLSRVSSFAAACRELNIPYAVTLTDFFCVCHYSTMIDSKGAYCQSSCAGKNCNKRCGSSMISSSEQRYRTARKILDSAGFVACPSNFAESVFSREFPGLPVYVIPHGVAAAEKKTEKSGGMKRFLFAGAIAEAKGISVLLDAFLLLHSEECVLDIYGDGQDRYVRRLKKKSYPDKRVRFWGRVSQKQLESAYQNADCVIIPSLVPETYNFVIHDALQRGCMVIASRIGALPEAVREGENGLLVQPGSAEALLKAMQSILFLRARGRSGIRMSQPETEAAHYYYLYAQVK